jgi:hypothetical protein
MNRFQITSREIPTPEEKSLFAARRDELKRWLAPAGRTVAEPVLGLLTAMPSQSAGGVDPAMRVVTFVEDLGDLPLFAVTRACSDFRRGVVGSSKHWAPTAAEIREQAEKIAAPFWKEFTDVAEVAEFEPPHVDRIDDPASMRERVRQVADDAIRAIRGIPDVDPDQIRSEAQAALDRMISDPQPPPAMSDALRAVLARRTEAL